MSQKHSRKARKIIRGFQRHEAMYHGNDNLWDLKIQKELLKMMSEAHLQEVKQHLPKEEAERVVISWLEESDKIEDEGP